MSGFWNENFSWSEGKFSPRNILAGDDDEEKKEKEDKILSREDRLLNISQEDDMLEVFKPIVSSFLLLTLFC